MSSKIDKTKVESVQLEKILTKFSVSPPSLRPRVKCCGWDWKWGRGGSVEPANTKVRMECGFWLD